MCERFGKLPAEIYAADAELIQLLSIEHLGKPLEETTT